MKISINLDQDVGKFKRKMEDFELTEEEVLAQMDIETKEDLLSHIDSKLTAEERNEIINAEDVGDLDSVYAIWLRNLLIYPNIIDVYELLHPEDSAPFRILHNDLLSAELMMELQGHLRTQERNMTK